LMICLSFATLFDDMLAPQADSSIASMATTISPAKLSLEIESHMVYPPEKQQTSNQRHPTSRRREPDQPPFSSPDRSDAPGALTSLGNDEDQQGIFWRSALSQAGRTLVAGYGCSLMCSWISSPPRASPSAENACPHRYEMAVRSTRVVTEDAVRRWVRRQNAPRSSRNPPTSGVVNTHGRYPRNKCSTAASVEQAQCHP
jgi:hypothetical protein